MGQTGRRPFEYKVLSENTQSPDEDRMRHIRLFQGTSVHGLETANRSGQTWTTGDPPIATRKAALTLLSGKHGE